MQIESIQLFCAVARSRSVSRAARESGITQSAASQRIQALERELSVRLIDRSKRPLELTEAGRVYHRGCRRILDQYEQLKQRIQSASRPLRGEIGIAAIYSSGIDWLSAVKEQFEQAHPETTISIDLLQPDAVYEQLRQERCDFGILSFPERWEQMESVLMREEPMSVVAAPNHPIAGRERVHVRELIGRTMVGFDRDLPIGERIHAYLREHGVRPNIVNRLDNVDTVKTYVTETDAVAILPEPPIHRELEQGLLSRATLGPRLARPLAMMSPSHRQPRPPASAFMDYLLAHQPPWQDDFRPTDSAETDAIAPAAFV